MTLRRGSATTGAGCFRAYAVCGIPPTAVSLSRADERLSVSQAPKRDAIPCRGHEIRNERGSSDDVGANS